MSDPADVERRHGLRARFDDDPGGYERSRPVAPGQVFDEAVTRAGLGPGSAVVEIGPGTGQATRELSQRGLRVLGLELGPGLAALARRNLAGVAGVEVVTSSFEAWDPSGAHFDAVVACNSFHWVDPGVRFGKAAAVMGSMGHLVVLDTPWVIPEDADRFWWAVQDDWVAVGASRVDPATKHPDLVNDLEVEVEASGAFERPVVRRLRFEVRYTAEGYAMALSTQSAVKELPYDAQTELVARVRHRLERSGGSVTAHFLAVLTVARRASQAPT